MNAHPDSCGSNCFGTRHLFSDSVFDDKKWNSYTSWRRHLPEPLLWPEIIIALSPMLIWVFVVSTLIAVYSTLSPIHGWQAITLSSTKFLPFFALMATPLVLLLVFRTNSCFARWWEGRTAVSVWVHSCRCICRQATCVFPYEEAHLAAELVRWIRAFPAVAAAYICHDPSFYDNCANVLTLQELAWVQAASCPPHAVLQAMSRLLKKSTALIPPQVMSFEAVLNQLDLSIATCDRLRAHPIPLAYTRHASRFCFIFVTFFPFALWSDYGYVSIPVTVVTAFLLFGIENIGVQIENPFRVLPIPLIVEECQRMALACMQERIHAEHFVDEGVARAKLQYLAPSCEPASLRQGKRDSTDSQHTGSEEVELGPVNGVAMHIISMN